MRKYVIENLGEGALKEIDEPEGRQLTYCLILPRERAENAIMSCIYWTITVFIENKTLYAGLFQIFK